MAGNAVKLTFAGDATSLDRAMDSVQSGAKKTADSLDGMKRHGDEAGDGFARAGDKLEGSTGKFRGGKDAVDGMTDTLGSLGVALPGPIGNISMMAGGFADLADGVATTVLPALKGLWAVMAANPLFLVIAGVALLVTGFIVAYKKSETFRNIVNSTFEAVKSGAKAMGDVFMKVGEALFFPYKTAFNLIADAWNNTVGRLSFSIPGWVPGIGGNGWDVPDIPHFANGGTMSYAGFSWVGERGPELVKQPAGSRVIPANQTGAYRGGGQMTLVIQGPSDDLFVQWLRKQARVLGGGNVQAAFGRGA
jgi:hypothetical protein